MGIMDWFRGKAPSPGIYSGGAGDSADTAIVISVTNSMAGIPAEYAFVQQQCGQQDVDWTLNSQMQTSQDGKKFDVLTVTLKDGGSRAFWFDITAFYGRF
ncbi:MAG TPA: hypothetical protein VLH56_02345 [Dissulfurispiraceae bacterium]|nr:hypothetical protein [Dissulfurispiraceae bacterium]